PRGAICAARPHAPDRCRDCARRRALLPLAGRAHALAAAVMSALLLATNLSLPGRLDDASLALAPGTLTCLVGPNGSGKTSLLHDIAGIARASGGVAIDGVDPSREPPARRAHLLGFLPASRDIQWPLIARDLVALGGATPGEITATLAALELGGVAHRRIDRLSTGER